MIKVTAHNRDSGCYEDLKINFIQFSGGERHVGIDTDHVLYYDEYHITAHMTNSNDFFDIALVQNAIRNMHGQDSSKQCKMKLWMPYVPYARQDRVCAKGQACSIKVFANLINSLEFDSVHIVDPHSDVTPALINNCIVDTQSTIVDDVMGVVQANFGFSFEQIAIVSPDAGAMKKAFSSEYSKDKSQIVMHKKRNPATGKIEKTEIVMGDAKDKVCIIVDDIADGGRTFTEAAQVLREAGAKKVYLYVTHGIFSKGLTPLKEHIDGVITTNSFLFEIPERLKAEIESDPTFLTIFNIV